MDWRTTSGALVALIVVFAIIWSRVSIDWEDEYQELYESFALDTPLISSDWEVHLDEKSNSLIYIKEECSVEDTQPKFLLHLVPVDFNDIPPYQRPPYQRSSSSFDNRDFEYIDFGRQLPRRICIIKYVLPYDVSSIRTGQYIGQLDQLTNIWTETVVVNQAQAR